MLKEMGMVILLSIGQEIGMGFTTESVAHLFDICSDCI
jgi:hypothetical protein